MALLGGIPGETPIDDISGLKVKDIRRRSELSVVEARNIRKAFVKYLAAKPSRKLARFDYGWALQLHKEMFGDVWDWAGMRRVKDGGNIGVPCIQIEQRLAGLLEDLKVWGKYGTPLIEQAVLLHHKAVEIHPFQNGNGRWSRLLANIWLRQNEHPITEWPEETVGEASVVRDEYIKAIKSADRGEYSSLLELHRRFTARA